MIKTIKKVYPNCSEIKMEQDSRYKSLIDVYVDGKRIGMFWMSALPEMLKTSDELRRKKENGLGMMVISE